MLGKGIPAVRDFRKETVLQALRGSYRAFNSIGHTIGAVRKYRGCMEL